MRNFIEKSRALHPATQHAFGERIPFVNTDAGFYANQRRQAVIAAIEERKSDILTYTDPRSTNYIVDDLERADAKRYFDARLSDKVVKALIEEAQGMATNHPHSTVAKSLVFLKTIEVITNNFAIGAHDPNPATRAAAKVAKDQETEKLLKTLHGRQREEAKALLEEPSTDRVFGRRAFLETVVAGGLLLVAGEVAREALWGTKSGTSTEFIPPSSSQPTPEPGNPNVLEYQSLIGADPQTMVQDFGGDAANWIYIPEKQSWSYDGELDPIGGILRIPHGALAIVEDVEGHAYYVIGGQQGTTIQEGTINSFSMFSVDWVMANQPNLQINQSLEDGYGSWAPRGVASNAPAFEPISGPNVQVPSNFKTSQP